MTNSENSEKKRTNADKIRALPNEVLAAIIRGCCRGCDCFSCPLESLCNEVFRTETDWFDWLGSEADDDE